VREEYAETDDKYFSLKPKVLELGFAALSSMTFVDVIQPVVTRLAATFEESCFAAVLDGTEVVYIASASPPDRIMQHIEVVDSLELAMSGSALVHECAPEALDQAQACYTAGYCSR